MPKSSKGAAVAEKPAKASKKSRAVEEEEEEDEAPARKPAKASKNGKTAVAPVKTKAKAAVAAPAKKKAKADEDEGYTPNKNSMRDFIMRAMRRGGSSQDIKKRAARYAEKAGIDNLSDAKSYKNFDVAYFAKFLKEKGFDMEIDEKNDTYSLAA